MRKIKSYCKNQLTRERAKKTQSPLLLVLPYISVSHKKEYYRIVCSVASLAIDIKIRKMLTLIQLSAFYFSERVKMLGIIFLKPQLHIFWKTFELY